MNDFLTEKNKKAGNKQGIQFQIQSKIGASIIVVRAVIAVLRGKFIALNAYIAKE